MMDVFVDLLRTGQYWLIIPVIIIAIVFNATKILITYETLKKSKLGIIKESFEAITSKSTTKEFLDEVLEMEAFKVSTGIMASKERRELLIQFYKKNRSNIPLHGLRYSSPHIQVDNGKLNVKFAWHDYVGYYLNWVFAIFSYFVGVAIFFLVFSQGSVGIQNNIEKLCQAFIFIGFGVFALIQAMPVLWAKRIRKILIE